MQYAVIKTSGRQFVVRPNESFTVDKIEAKEGESIVFEDVLLFVDGEKAAIGSPIVKNTTVHGKVVAHKRGDKIRVGKYKAKSRYRRVNGFRAELTEIMIESIKSTKTKEEK